MTVEAHLDSYSPEITDKIKNDIYMDTVITGANTESEATDLYSQSKTIQCSQYESTGMNDKQC